MRLTYADESFDLALSSETLEHVPDFGAALRELRRVLRRGGRAVFTVPILASRATTEARAPVRDDGTIEHLSPPLYNGRGSGLFRYLPVGSDLLAFTEFGRDFEDHIRAAGLEPELIDGEDETDAGFVFCGCAPQ